MPAVTSSSTGYTGYGQASYSSSSYGVTPISDASGYAASGQSVSYSTAVTSNQQVSCNQVKKENTMNEQFCVT